MEDYLSLVNLMTSMVALFVAAIALVHASRANRLQYRQEWFNAYDTLRDIERRLTDTYSSPFGEMIEQEKMRQVMNLETLLDDEQVGKMYSIMYRSQFWKPDSLYQSLEEVVSIYSTWEQLKDCIDEEEENVEALRDNAIALRKASYATVKKAVAILESNLRKVSS
jgi:hypothetical protein